MVEHCCSITSLQLGETLGSVTKDMDTYSYREPLGVCAGVTPFNFPAMIPLWVSVSPYIPDHIFVECMTQSVLACIGNKLFKTYIPPTTDVSHCTCVW